MSRNTFDHHFKKNPTTSKNPYYKIDALAWSNIYLEKVDRYSPEVYLMGEYIVKSYNYFKQLSFDDIDKGRFHFDAYRCDLDYYEKIVKINPPLSEEEFEAELDSPSVKKKFFYNYDEEDLEMPIDVEKNNVIDHRFYRIKNKIF